MPMPKPEYEKLLNELVNPELDQTRRTEILQTMRTDYGKVHAEHEDLTERTNILTKDNNDLLQSNSQLFRQLGIVGENKEEQEEIKQANFSETVTIEDLEKTN